MLLAGVLFGVPVSAGKSFVALVLERMRADLVPTDVALIITNPMDAFITQVTIAVFLAILLLAPLVALEAWRFVAPGLYSKERRGLLGFMGIALALWYGGAAFAYAVLVPATYSALYGFLPEGVLPYFSLRELVGMTAGLVLAAGLIFLLPVGMALLSRLGLVPAQFWAVYARHALVLVLVGSAILTPDGSGVSMVLLALPVCALYAVGYAGARALAP